MPRHLSSRMLFAVRRSIRGWQGVIDSMRRKALAVIILICLLQSMQPAAAATETEVAVTAPAYVNVGTSCTVNVTVHPEEVLGGMECGILFNASVLEAQQVNAGGLFEGWWNSSLDIDNDNGSISQLLGFNYEGNGTTGQGTFASVTFTATGEGQGWIRLVNVSLSDPTGNESVPYHTSNDTIAIVDDSAAPEFNYSLDPATPNGDNGWYVSPVEVWMNASDDYGVKNVSYRVDDDGWHTIPANTTTFSVSTDGNHTVYLKATDLVGNANDTSFTLKVDRTPPAVQATVNGTEIEENVCRDNVTINITADDAVSGLDSIEYRLDDTGWKDYSRNFSVTDPGNHTLLYRAVDRAGNAEQDQKSFKVITNTGPIANFSYTPTKPSTMDTVEFTDNSSDPDGSITAWEWSFGDGDSSNRSNPSHSYGDGGSYQVTLTVTDDEGDSNTTSRMVAVSNVEPSVGFSYSPPGPSPADTVQFTDEASDPDGSIASYSWRFGDGTTSTAQHPGHRYSSEGTYTVELTVTDDDGAQASTSQEITVSNHRPAASFSYTPDAPTAMDVIRFTSQSSDPDGSIASYSWRFGDGGSGSGSGKHVEHSYGSPGKYTVTLTVTDNRGKTDSVQHVVWVNDPPAAACEVPAEGVVGTPVNVTDRSSDSDGSIVNWTWRFGDGNQSYRKNASHRYSEAGVYTVTLQVEDNRNDTNSTSQQITVRHPYEFSVTGISHHTSLFGDDSVTMSIENSGGKAADGVACRLFIDGSTVETKRTGELAAGGAATLSFTIDVSPLHGHTIQGIVDPDDEFREGNENDNERSIDVPINWLLVAAITAAAAAVAGIAVLLYRRRRGKPADAAGRKVEVQDDRQIQRCFVCRGKLKADAAAVRCECGKVFHRSCARRVGECPDCGRELDGSRAEES